MGEGEGMIILIWGSICPFFSSSLFHIDALKESDFDVRNATHHCVPPKYL